MKDLVDHHRSKISAAANARDTAIVAATGAFQEAVAAYRDATQRAADEYSAAVTASEAALDVQMESRTRDFFGEVPVKEPTVKFTAPAMPQTSDGPALDAAGHVDGDAAGAEGGA